MILERSGQRREAHTSVRVVHDLGLVDLQT